MQGVFTSVFFETGFGKDYLALHWDKPTHYGVFAAFFMPFVKRAPFTVVLIALCVRSVHCGVINLATLLHFGASEQRSCGRDSLAVYRT